MTSSQTLQVQTYVQGPIPAEMVELAERHVRAALRLASEPVLFARVRLTLMADPAVAHPAVAQANIDLNGRQIRAQAADVTMANAIDRMDERLRVQLARAARNWAALRARQPLGQPHEWRHRSTPDAPMPYYPRPAEERAVIRHKTYALARQTAADAVADAELLGYDFHLFTDKATGEDSVIYRTQDGYRLMRAHARSGHAGSGDPLITVSEHAAPKLGEAEAIIRLDSLGQSFLFFVDSKTGRGNLLYHRYDGHYGLITPADT